jgi:hypothetical protein
MALSIASFVVELLSNKIVVELLWTLKSHSLGQSEDQVEMFSKLHFIPYLISVDLQVIFNGKLVVHPHRIPTFWQYLPIIRGTISYPPGV